MRPVLKHGCITVRISDKQVNKLGHTFSNPTHSPPLSPVARCHLQEQLELPQYQGLLQQLWPAVSNEKNAVFDTVLF